MSKRKTPVLRFKGFHNDWEQRKLGGYIEVTKNKNKNMLLYPAFSISNIKGFVAQEEQFGKDNTYSKTDKSTNYIVEPGMFAYNPARINVGSIAYQNQHEPVLVSSLYEIFKVKSEIDDSFLMNWFKTSLFNNQVKRLEEGGVRQYFFIDKMQETKIGLPSISEQKNISKILKLINKNLDLQQQKLDNLIILKRAYLSMLFPTKEENNPKIRFAKFSNNWEKRKFNTFVERISNNTSCNFPNVTYDDIDSKNGILNKKVSQLSRGKHGILFQKNDILYGKLRPYLNNIIKASFKGIAVGDFWILRANEDPDFFLALIYTSRYKYITSISTGSKMPRADWKLVSNYNFYIPSIEEQKWIGNMISKLSYLILLEQKRILLFKKIKHFLLQNIFI
ncbi:restriction endonuclease subunit S [Lactobacillus acetotolerans]|jgi:type I restriction enzyme S subunit|uniref:restriction endonuclease subunit S n=1 Tax=Lactobacillus acetotolerans TaxID=1600 RepID=UPI0014522BCF|nr:restriction endonuclease subunit S [Lactobacillus acetotolerans]QJD73531.1 restriction endonuclease subunit S [Lactobacillus acetotolerans]